MLARLPAHLTMIVLGCLAGILLALFAAPAYAPPNGAPVQIIDADNTDQVARVGEDGAVHVTGDVQVSGAATIDGSVEVSNLPETQDVTVTNAGDDPVPVRLAGDSGRVTLNTFEFDVPAGEVEVVGPGPGFQSLDAFFVQVTGADDDVTVLFNNNGTKLVLRGEGDFGIGQEDYAI
jgi:hypothetical protein